MRVRTLLRAPGTRWPTAERLGASAGDGARRSMRATALPQSHARRIAAGSFRGLHSFTRYVLPFV